MCLTPDEQTELLQKVREIHAAVADGTPVVMTPEDRAAIVDGLLQGLSPELQASLRNALFTVEMNVPIPAGVATFSPKRPSGT